jgi:predicted CopG family antitoxin
MAEEMKNEEEKTFLDLLIEYVQQKREALKPKLEKATGS